MKRCPARVLGLIVLVSGCAGALHAETQRPQVGWSSAALYNLANAYARAGKAGPAVLNYERASLIAPGDPDIEANLLLVRRSAGLAAEPRSRWNRAVGGVNPMVASGMGAAGWLLVASALFAGRLQAARPAARRAAFILGIALVGFTVANGLTFWPKLHEAIVIAGAAPARVSPAPMGETLFTLKEAEAVTIAGEHEGFVLVHAPARRTGWIWHADLAPVVP